jgi:hypothetical protein
VCRPSWVCHNVSMLMSMLSSDPTVKHDLRHSPFPLWTPVSFIVNEGIGWALRLWQSLNVVYWEP